MARSTDGSSRRQGKNLAIAFVFTALFGVALGDAVVNGPSAAGFVFGVACALVAYSFGWDAYVAHLARRRARVARAVSTDQAQDEVREVPETTVFRTTAQDEAVTEVQGDHIGPRTVFDTQGRSIRIIRGPLADITLDLMQGIDHLPMAGDYDRPDRLLFAARVKSVQTLVIELHTVVDEHFFGGAIPGAEAKDVNDAVQALLRAMGVPTEALKRPRDRFVGLRKPNPVQN